jgi:hypothetical protein
MPYSYYPVPTLYTYISTRAPNSKDMMVCPKLCFESPVVRYAQRCTRGGGITSTRLPIGCMPSQMPSATRDMKKRSGIQPPLFCRSVRLQRCHFHLDCVMPNHMHPSPKNSASQLLLQLLPITLHQKTTADWSKAHARAIRRVLHGLRSTLQQKEGDDCTGESRAIPRRLPHFTARSEFEKATLSWGKFLMPKKPIAHPIIHLWRVRSTKLTHNTCCAFRNTHEHELISFYFIPQNIPTTSTTVAPHPRGC